MFPSSSLHDSGSNVVTTNCSPQQHQQPRQPQQPEKGQQQAQQGMLSERRDPLAEKMDLEVLRCPFVLPFVEDPFFAAVLPFKAVDGFLRGAALDSMRKLMADEQRQLQQRCPFWTGDTRWSSGSSTYPSLFHSYFFEPEFFASAPSPLFRIPWWRPSFWVQQRQLDQQQQQLQQEQQGQQLRDQQERLAQGQQQEQQRTGVSRALRPINKSSDASAAAADAEDGIPVIFPQNKSHSPLLPAGATPDKKTLRHLAADPASAAAAEEKAAQMRRWKWLTDPFFLDPFCFYPPRFWDMSLQEDEPAVAATSRSPASHVAAVGTGPPRSPCATTSSTSSGAPPTFVPFAAPFAAAAFPSIAAVRSAPGHACAVSGAAWGGPLPRIDIRDCGEVLLIDAEVPGFQKENLHVSIEGKGVLRISGEQGPHPPPQPQQQQQNPQRDVLQQPEGRFHLQERTRSCSFSRAISLPANVKEDDIRASMSDGVLHVRIPKEDAAVVKPSRVIAIE